MLLTLNQIISQITTLAAAHSQIAASGVGDFAEWQAEERNYPLLWVFHETTSVGNRELIYSIRLICADRVITGEEGEDTDGMEQEVLSDTLLILLDFLAYFQQQHTQTYTVVPSATIDPFTERFNDRVAGNSMVIQIRQPFTWDSCQIPQTGATIPPTVDGLTLYDFCDQSVIDRLTDAQIACLEAEFGQCADATVTVNSSPYGTAPSGGSENVEVVSGVMGTTPRGSLIGGKWFIAYSPFQINGVNADSLPPETTFNLIVRRDGVVNSGSYDSGTDTLDITSATDLTIIIDVQEDAVTASVTIVADSDGTITAVNAGGLTNLVITVNATPVTVPFALAVADLLELAFDAATADTNVILTGTYTP